MDGSEWKAALRLQVEALARRNEIHGRSNRESVKNRTSDMNSKILKLRELLSTDTNLAAQYYLECVCHVDETEKILNRTSTRDKKLKKLKLLKDSISTASAPTLNTVPSTSAVVELIPERAPFQDEASIPQRARWWDHFNIHRRVDDYTERRNEIRQLWKTQKDFFFSCLGFMIGVGNIIQFPAKISEFGGAFFIPYTLCMLFFGFPLVFLHLSIGQYSGQSVSCAFKRFMPIASGLGWALILIAIPIAIYYNIIIAWAIYYFWNSIKGFFQQGPLPWENCLAGWALIKSCCNLQNLSSCDLKDHANSSITASEAFFHFEVLSLSDSSEFSLGPLQSHLVICLALAWILVFVGVCKGVGSIGWTTNITATLPYLLLQILFLRGISLPGANKGLSFLFSIDYNKVSSLKMWRSAATQVFYELGIGAGPLISMAAFSRYRNNIYRDAILLVSIDVVTSFLTGIVIFSFVGFLVHSTDIEIADILKNDPLYLSFTVYPGISSFMGSGALWTALFFAMIIIAAIDAEFAWLEMIATSIMDKLFVMNKEFENRLLVGLCLSGFILGLPLCTSGGIYLFQAIDNHNANWNSFTLALLVILVIGYFYGIEQFLDNVSSMLRVALYTKRKWKHLKTMDRLRAVLGPNGLFIRWSLTTICPLILVVLLIASIINYERVYFAGRTILIAYESIAWLIMTGPLIVIPICAIQNIIQTRRNGKMLSSLFDTSQWSQESKENSEIEHQPSFTYRSEPRRENTYMYIDPASRGPTVRSSAVPAEENYGWRSGRLKECQDNISLAQSPSQPSFAASFASQATANGELNLFGSPPLSNAFMISDAITIKARVKRRSDKKSSRAHNVSSAYNALSPTDDELQMRPIHSSTEQSELEFKISSSSDPVSHCTSAPLPRTSPCRSEPPLIRTEGAKSYSQRSKSESHDEHEADTDEDDEYGIRPQRVTVIRRFRSEDSFQAQSTGSISITPVDIVRQRSLSSVAIYDQRQVRPTQTLSQLKRPAPIDAPTRF